MEKIRGQFLENELDATWLKKSDYDDIDWVVHDSNGSLINFRMKKIMQKLDIKILETKTILEGIKSISNTYMQNQISLQVEYDSIVVVKVLSGETEDFHQWDHFPLLTLECCGIPSL